MPVYAIVLEPDSKLSYKTNALKDKAKSLSGGLNQYLDDPPHTTLYLGNFKPSSQWVYDFSKMISSISNVSLHVLGWHRFANDPITKKDTLVCSLEPTEQLLSLQRKVVEFLNSYRTYGLVDRYAKVYNSLDKAFQANLDKYGFPFIGSIWIPHLSIGSFDKSVYDKVWMNLKDKCPVGSYHAYYLSIYRIGENDKIMVENQLPIKNS